MDILSPIGKGLVSYCQTTFINMHQILRSSGGNWICCWAGLALTDQISFFIIMRLMKKLRAKQSLITLMNFSWTSVINYSNHLGINYIINSKDLSKALFLLNILPVMCKWEEMLTNQKRWLFSLSAIRHIPRIPHLLGTIVMCRHFCWKGATFFWPLTRDAGSIFERPYYVYTQ